MDIKHVFSLNPLLPAYQAPQLQVQTTMHPLTWVEFDGGLKEIGHSGSGFTFDNESPRHKIWLEPFRLAARPCQYGSRKDRETPSACNESMAGRGRGCDDRRLRNRETRGGKGVSHDQVKEWIESWGGKHERPAPNGSRT